MIIPALRAQTAAIVGIGILAAACPQTASAAVVVNVSIPSGSMDGSCWPADSGVYSETPEPAAVGIGRIVDPLFNFGFSLHDHGYIAPHVPDPARSVVTYRFDSPAIVTGLELNVHANGISMIEALIGDSLGSLVSLGTFTGSLGAPLGSVAFTEHDVNTFSFANLTPGLYFQFIVKETPHSDGYANYHAIPIQAVPEPDTYALLAGLGLLGFAAWRKQAKV